MKHEQVQKLKQGDEVFYAGHFYEFAGLKFFPHGDMIGIYDEPPSSKHIDYLQPENVSEVMPCHACQGGGCPVCSGYGKIIN